MNPQAQEDRAAQREPARRQRDLKITMGITLFGLKIVFWVLINGIWFDRTFETGVGDRREVTLTDGTIVRLEPRTEMRVAFGDDRRDVFLRHGDAYFEIAKDARRPFVVRAQRAEVRAVGTAFGVRNRGERIVVTVREGRVEVTRQSGGDFDRYRGGTGRVAVLASQGEQVTVSAFEPLVTRRVDLVAELAWTRGQMVLMPGTVADALQESNRLNKVQIEVDDPALESRQIRGTFATNHPLELAKQLARALDAKMVVVSDRSRVLRIVGAEELE